MTVWHSPAGRLLACCACLLLVSTPAAFGSERGVEHRTLFRFADPAITESSGLVDAGRVVWTTNDSGSGPVLYAVDTTTGRTARVTTYSHDDVVDVEALAPGPDGVIWVGDIGDNRRSRPQVSVYRVDPRGDGVAPRYDLTYPGGPRDAETLLVQPRSGRVFVVSKTVFGGTVYAMGTPGSGRTGRLRPFARVPGLVTDGAFFPDGRHVLLRGYGAASVYGFPGFELEGTVTLPAQQQGEGVSIGADGRILLSSEGVHAPVLQIDLPPALADVVAGRSPSVSASPRPSQGAVTGDRAVAGEEPGADGGPGPLWILLGAAVLGALAGVVRVTRRR